MSRSGLSPTNQHSSIGTLSWRAACHAISGFGFRTPISSLYSCTVNDAASPTRTRKSRCAAPQSVLLTTATGRLASADACSTSAIPGRTAHSGRHVHA
jgi:hypothetical protein